MTDFSSKNNMILMTITFTVIALFFLILPGLVKQINIFLKKSISTKKISESLDMMRDIDIQIFKIGKVIGAISLILALIFLYLYMKI